MNCRKFREKIAELFDIHPKTQVKVELEAHLETCPKCKEEYRKSLMVIKQLTPACLADISTGFEERVINSLNEYDYSPRPWFDLSGLSWLFSWKKAAVVLAAVLLLVSVLVVDWSAIVKRVGGKAEPESAFSFLRTALAAEEKFPYGEGITHVSKVITVPASADSHGCVTTYDNLTSLGPDGKRIYNSLRLPFQLGKGYAVSDDAWYDKANNRFLRLVTCENKVLYAYSYSDGYVYITERLRDGSLKITGEKAVPSFSLPDNLFRFFGLVASQDSSYYSTRSKKDIIDLGQGQLEDGTPVRRIKIDMTLPSGKVISYRLLKIRLDNNTIAEEEMMVENKTTHIFRYNIASDAGNPPMPWNLAGVDSLLYVPRDIPQFEVEFQGQDTDLSVDELLDRADLPVYLFASSPSWTGIRRIAARTDYIQTQEGPLKKENISILYIAPNKRHVVLAQSYMNDIFSFFKAAKVKFVYSSPGGFKLWNNTGDEMNSMHLFNLYRVQIPDTTLIEICKKPAGLIVRSPAGTFFPIVVNGPLSRKEMTEFANNLVLAEEYQGRSLLQNSESLLPWDKYSWTALFAAVGQGDTAKTRELVRAGFNPNTANPKTGFSVLMLAAGLGRTELVKLLLESGAQANTKSKTEATALWLAAGSGHKETAEYLLQSGADLTAGLVSKDSALIKATREGNTMIASLLIKAGADINKKSESGEPPLVFAAGCGQVEIVKLLLDAGASIDSTSSRGQSALIAAAGSGSTASVKLLLQAGADINQKGHSGRTALMYAASNGPPDLVRFLIKAGADLNIVNDDGLTALGEAEKRKMWSTPPDPQRLIIIEILKKAGAR